LRLTGLLIALLTGSLAAPAQVGDNDTTVTTVEVAPVEEESASAEEKVTIPEPRVLRKVPDSITRKLQKQDDFAYANDPAYWEREPEPQIENREPRKGFWDYFNDFFAKSTIRSITYGILIAFFLFVIYRIIVVNKLFLFYSSKKARKEETGEAIDIDNDNLDEKIKQAVDVNDYRLAVRFMYLKALKLLNDRQWIRFHAEATNYEYVNQMSNHKLGNDFGFLTRVYDYVWYGEFTLTPEQFEIVNKNFSHFYNAIPS